MSNLSRTAVLFSTAVLGGALLTTSVPALQLSHMLPKSLHQICHLI